MSDVKTAALPDVSPDNTNRHAAKAEARKAGADAIGEALKAYFDDLSSEPVPDRFIDLLASLENK